MTISDAASICADSGLEGWDLVNFAQSVVNTTMTYSYTNSYDMPSVAFRKERGYCWQQAKARNALDRLYIVGMLFRVGTGEQETIS